MALVFVRKWVKDSIDLIQVSESYDLGIHISRQHNRNLAYCRYFAQTDAIISLIFWNKQRFLEIRISLDKVSLPFFYFMFQLMDLQ